MIDLRYGQAIQPLRRHRSRPGLDTCQPPAGAGDRERPTSALGEIRRARASHRGASERRPSRRQGHARLRPAVPSGAENTGLDGRAPRRRELMAWVVDTCVLIDVLEEDPSFGFLSAEILEESLEEGLVICPMTYAELS